jgi:hypothetical protein
LRGRMMEWMNLTKVHCKRILKVDNETFLYNSDMPVKMFLKDTHLIKKESHPVDIMWGILSCQNHQAFLVESESSAQETSCNAGTAYFPYKGQGMNIFGFPVHMLSVLTTYLCSLGQNQ